MLLLISYIGSMDDRRSTFFTRITHPYGPQLEAWESNTRSSKMRDIETEIKERVRLMHG